VEERLLAVLVIDRVLEEDDVSILRDVAPEARAHVHAGGACADAPRRDARGGRAGGAFASMPVIAPEHQQSSCRGCSRFFQQSSCAAIDA
jgi:hypothetical protein